MSKSHERMVAFFAGNVQGVGFRYQARRLASAIPIAGTVENLTDGRVKLVAEGPRSQLEQLLWELENEMSRWIVDSQVHFEPATHEFSEFMIVR